MDTGEYQSNQHQSDADAFAGLSNGKTQQGPPFATAASVATNGEGTVGTTTRRDSVSPVVILAGDDADHLRHVSARFTSEGARAVCSLDWETFNTSLAETDPALVLTSLDFAGHGAVRVLQRVSESGCDAPVAFFSDGAAAEEVVSALKAGAADVVSKSAHNDHVDRLVQLLKRHFEHRLRQQQPVRSRPADSLLLGCSDEICDIRRLIEEVAPTEATVMIHGESGTGKELVAREIHRASRRSKNRFVPVNMSAIPSGLAESTLFGHVKGSFTSADRTRKGWCEAAHSGTLFLDEVSEMELSVQPLLLRFLQEGTIQPVGSDDERNVDARIITATNRDPKTMVQDGRLREDLFFRLHVVPIHLPPLRERPQDIQLLANLFVERAAKRHLKQVRGFAADAMHCLLSYHWPGNVRQLENVVERLVIFSKTEEIVSATLPAELREVDYASVVRLNPRLESESHSSNGDSWSGELTPMQRFERAAIVDALGKTSGNVVQASKLLGVGQATVYRKIKQYEIERQRYKRTKKRP